MTADVTWTPERLIAFPTVTDVQLSPDGRRILYALREPLLTDEESRFVSHLYLADAEGGAPLRLTYGPHDHACARWSPDGAHIAFLSDRAGKGKNVYVLRAAGGEAWQLTAREKGVQGLEWSPDGTRLAIAAVAPDSPERQADRKAKRDVVRWGVDHDRAGLWILPFCQGDEPRPEPRRLTPDTQHVCTFGWAEDGGALVYTYQPTPVADDWVRTCLAVVQADADSPSPRDLGPLETSSPCKVLGGRVACRTAVQGASWMARDRVSVWPLDGGAATPLAETPDSQPWLLGWSADGASVYVLEAQGTGSALMAVGADGAAPRTLLEGAGYLSQVQTNGRDAFALVVQGANEPPRLCTWAVGDGAPRPVTTLLPAGWPTERAPRTESFRVRSADGWDIDALVTYPNAYRAGQAVPTIVMVHGGPAGAFSEVYMAGLPGPYPIAAFAERGYAVLRVNPRGSSGYGAAFRRANVRDWGGGDLRDILAALDDLVARGVADPERLGIMGWSYGGYMTSWMITQTDRFRAASVGAGVVDLLSFNGTADIPGFLPDYMQAEFWDDAAVYMERSAVFRVQDVSTPTLIQHGRDDVRVPLGQGLELYNALKRRGVPVEMDIYPREGHGFQEPRAIMDLMRRNLEWFARWIGPAGGAPENDAGGDSAS